MLHWGHYSRYIVQEHLSQAWTGHSDPVGSEVGTFPGVLANEY